MKLFRFDAEALKHAVTAFDSRNVAVSGILRDAKVAHIGCFYLSPDGIIGHHPAGMPQILLVVQGTGEVRGEDCAFVPITAGQAVFWGHGEGHETRSANGMTALVIEGPSLDPAALMVPL